MVFDLFHESIQDNLDLFGHLAMESEGEEQLKYSKHFQQFYQLLPEGGRLEYGRVFTRLCLLRVAFGLTVGLLLLDPNVDREQLMAEFGEAKPLNEWSKNDWERCKESLGESCETILKQGAVVGINDPNDESICQERADSKKYNIERIIRGLETCAILAPLRYTLKDQLADKRKKGTPKVSRNILSNFQREVEKLDDPKLVNVLRALVIKHETTGDLKMKGIGEVRSVLESNQLSVERAATKTLGKLKSWNKDLFRKPRLYLFHFDESDDELLVEEEEESEEEEEWQVAHAAVETPRISGARLPDSIDDPLEETKAVAAKVSSSSASRADNRVDAIDISDDDDEEDEDQEPSPKNPAAIFRSSPETSSKKRKRQDDSRFLKKKQSAAQMIFDDDDDDEENRGLVEGLLLISDSLARLPASISPSGVRTPKRKSQQKSYEGKRKWTDQEEEAVKEGIRKLGKGKWAQIKEMFKIVLKDRTSGQIKDWHRNMVKRMKKAESRIGQL